jgi:APA family basic amino acid/polyamine antiporter
LVRYFNAGLLGLFGVGLPTDLLHGPGEGGLVNLPALAIVALLGVLLATGAKVSAQFNAIMVFVKVGAILLFLLAALGHIDAANWVPYIPERVVGSDGVGHFGVVGIFTAASLVFFAYIGFDAVSTAAESVGIRSATCRSASSPRSRSARCSTCWCQAC